MQIIPKYKKHQNLLKHFSAPQHFTQGLLVQPIDAAGKGIYLRKG
jgi:hypothetical protein